MTVVYLDSPPKTYSDWVDCFDKFKTGSMPDDEFVNVVSNGSCLEYLGIKHYLHPKIEEVVNVIINTAIYELRSDLNKFTQGNEISGMNVLFKRFEKRVSKSLFFMNIKFLDVEFKNDLKNEIEKQVYDFWNSLLKVIIRNAGSNNILFEEEIFLIKRIKLFSSFSKQCGAFDE